MNKGNGLNASNTIFYSTANAGYAVYAAVSLLTVRDHLPDARLYIISSRLSDYDRKILERHDIGYHEVDLSGIFYKTWDYPLECYYIFAGPEHFSRMGYEYSVYIDGDILCLDSPLAGVEEVSAVAGATSAPVDGEYISIFGEDWPKITDYWSLDPELARQPRINAGVVYFNNSTMKEFSLLQKAGRLFHEALENDMPRKGDDSLFSLLQYVYMDREMIRHLPPQYNFVLQFNEWNNPIEKITFFHFSMDKPWKKSPYMHDNPGLNIFNPHIREWRKKYRNAAPTSWARSVRVLGSVFALYDKVLRGLRKLNHILIVDVYLWLMGFKRNIFERRRNMRSDPIKLYWWRDFDINIQNFGDEITKDIIHKLIGYRSELATANDAELFGVGSILEIADKKSSSHTLHIWGSGFIRNHERDVIEGCYENTEFHAVRGHKTRQRVEPFVDNRITVGDPGLLVRFVYEPSLYKTNKIGVVAHYADADLPIIKKIMQDDRFILISPLQAPAEVALQITSCRLVLSSSLHGLIFADSYGVPNAHIRLSDRLKGGIYKFEDYYSALGLEYKCANLNMVFRDSYHHKLVTDYSQPSAIREVQANLVNAFPKLR